MRRRSALIGVAVALLGVMLAAPTTVSATTIKQPPPGYNACAASIDAQISNAGGRPTGLDVLVLADDNCEPQVKQLSSSTTLVKRLGAQVGPKGFPGPNPIHENVKSYELCGGTFVGCTAFHDTYSVTSFYNGTWTWQGLGFAGSSQNCSDYGTAGIFSMTAPACTWAGWNPGSAHALWADTTMEVCSNWHVFSFCTPKQISLSLFANGRTTYVIGNG
jgi:hypothetical protein